MENKKENHTQNEKTTVKADANSDKKDKNSGVSMRSSRETAKKPSAEDIGAYHCKRCRTQMVNGVCPSCGFKIYVPMSEDKRKKIRYVLGGVCLAVFLVIVIIKSI